MVNGMEDLQLPRGILTPYLEISHGYSIMKLMKEYHNHLHITYVDQCCLESDVITTVRYNDGVIEYYNIFLDEWTAITMDGLITLTTEGTSGEATLEGNVLNIPNYTLQNISVRAPIGESTFIIPELDGKTILSVARSGLVKGLIDTVTDDMEFLQVVGNEITLPTGDIINTVLLPDLTVVGELFFITYY